MDPPQFQGHPAFLEFAAAEIGHPEVAGPAARIAALGALANLCSQAIQANAAHVPEILVKAQEFRDQLHVAHVAADLMLDFIRNARGLRAQRPVKQPDPIDSEEPSRVAIRRARTQGSGSDRGSRSR